MARCRVNNLHVLITFYFIVNVYKTNDLHLRIFTYSYKIISGSLENVSNLETNNITENSLWFTFPLNICDQNGSVLTMDIEFDVIYINENMSQIDPL